MNKQYVLPRVINLSILQTCAPNPSSPKGKEIYAVNDIQDRVKRQN